jgi:uncharacterized protein YkwD
VFRAPRSSPTIARGFAAGLALLVASFAADAADPATPRITRAIASPAHEAGEVRALIALVNRHRTGRGCRPLAWDGRLARVALEHSRDMARGEFFSHENRRGEGPFGRMRKAGVRFRAAAENIALGQPTGREVFDDWVKSPGHRRNLDDCQFTHHGIGIHRGRWTHVFARY